MKGQIISGTIFFLDFYETNLYLFAFKNENNNTKWVYGNQGTNFQT